MFIAGLIALDSRFYYDFVSYNEDNNTACFLQRKNKENFILSGQTLLQISFCPFCRIIFWRFNSKSDFFKNYEIHK